MKYILEPTTLRTTIQVFKKGLRYRLIVTKFNRGGDRILKEYYEAFTGASVKRFIIGVLEEDFFNGITSKEIEITNFTKLNIKLGLIKVYNFNGKA